MSDFGGGSGFGGGGSSSIPPGVSTIENEGVAVVVNGTAINFKGDGVESTLNGTETDVHVPMVEVQEEGATINAADANKTSGNQIINIVGAGATATYGAGKTTITIPGAAAAPESYLVDQDITGTGVAATDLAALNAAIAAVAATSTSPKVIRIKGTYAQGTTAPTDFDNITLIFDRIEVTEAVSTAPFEAAVGGTIYVGQLDINGGSVGSQGMFHCQRVFCTVASGFGANTVIGNVASSPVIGDCEIRIHNLSSTAIYNFESSDWERADIIITGVSSGAQTYGISNSLIRARAPASNVALTISGVGNQLSFVGGGPDVVISGNSNIVSCEVAGSTSSINISGDGVILLMTAQINAPTITCSGDHVKVISLKNTTTATDVTLSGTGHNFDIAGSEFQTNANTATRGVYNVTDNASVAARTWTLGTRNTWNINSGVSGHKRTLATSALGTVCNLTMPGDGSADAVEIAATCDNSVFNIILTAAGSGLQIMAGATNNKIFVAGDTAPTFETAQAKYENDTTWLNTSTGQVTHYGQGTGKVVEFINLAAINALGAVTSGTITCGTLPIGARATHALGLNLGGAGATATTFMIKLGDGVDDDLYLVDGSVFAANVGTSTLGIATPDYTAAKSVVATLTADVNLNTVTGFANGLVAIVDYVES